MRRLTGTITDFIHKLWAPRPLITTGGFTREMALKTAETGQIVGFGQLFLANVSADDFAFHML